jgi:putative phosphoribosyl transferase
MSVVATRVTREITIPVRSPDGSPIDLPGRIVLPENATGIVLFAHGSGSSRSSPRNVHVAGVLHESWIGTLLFDLLTEQEAADRVNVFDVGLLADRLVAAVRLMAMDPLTASLPIGLFGASTGAAAAILAAAREPRVAAVVSRGGRVDMAGPWLRRVQAPTLLLVGAHDENVLALNREALEELDCPKQLVVVRGAGHLFEEPGTLEEVATLASEWFARHLGGSMGGPS